MEALGFTPSDFYYILPEIVLTAGALLVLAVDVIFSRRDGLTFGLTLGTLIVSAVFVLSFAGVDVISASRDVDRLRYAVVDV
mgnify:CR=1 FL=1